jgi:hypothetical protein
MHESERGAHSFLLSGETAYRRISVSETRACPDDFARKRMRRKSVSRVADAGKERSVSDDMDVSVSDNDARDE